MNWMKSILAVTISLVSISAIAAPMRGGHFSHGPRWGIGLIINPFPLFYSSYYPAPYYPAAYSPYPYRYYPEVMVETVITPVPNTVYIQPSNGTASTPYPAISVMPESGAKNGDWYYCHNPDGFYPSIKTCPAGWQRVPAQAPADR